MTAEEFRHKQAILQLNNRSLGALLGVPETSISNWSSGKREVPIYIEKALALHVEQHFQKLPIPLTLQELFALDRLARSRGIGVEQLLFDIIRRTLAQKPASTPIRYTPEEIASSRLNEDSPEPDPIRKRPA